MSSSDTRRFFKFCIVGGSGVVINMAVFAGVRQMAGEEPSLLAENTAVVLGFIVSCFTNFLLNDSWTWGDRKSKARMEFLQRIAAYYLVALVAFATQIATFNILLWQLPSTSWTPYLANLVGIGLGTIINFALNNVWTFGVGTSGHLTVAMLRVWRQQAMNRWAGVSVLWVSLAGMIAALAAIALYGAGTSTWIAWSREPHFDAWVRSAAFWFTILHVLVFAYTTFEVLYRSEDARVLTALPTNPRSWYTLVQIKAWVLHTPLLFPALVFSLPLLPMGRGDLFAYNALYFSAIFLAGIPLSLTLHLMAGRTMLEGRSATKDMLSDGLISAESSYLFFSPAAAFGATLSLAVLFEFALRFWFERGQAVPLVAGLIAIVILSIGSWRKGRTIFETTFNSILPRFRESEIVAPFEEKELPLQVLGLGLRRWLPERVGALFTRDLLQLRRRYRLGGFALVIFGGFLFLYAARAPSEAALWRGILLCTVFAGAIVFSPAFRLLGREIERAPLRGALPIAAGEQRLAHTAVLSLSLLPPVGLAMIVGLVFGATWRHTLLIGLGGAGGSLLFGILSLWLGGRAYPRIAPVAWSIRLGALALFAGLQSVWNVF